NLADLPQERRAMPLAIAITTSESEPQTFSEEVSLSYSPLAPVFDQVHPAGEHTVAKEAALPLGATVQSREGKTASLRARITHIAGGREVVSRELSGEGQLKIEQAI